MWRTDKTSPHRLISAAYALPDRQQVDTYPTIPYIYFVYIP